MSIRFPLSGVANGRLSTARIGTLTARMIRARRRIARNCADTCGSWAGTMVWFSSIAIACSFRLAAHAGAGGLARLVRPDHRSGGHRQAEPVQRLHPAEGLTRAAG